MNSLYYFREISKIPRGSGNCKAVADYIENFAVSHSLRCIRDKADNVIVFKPAAKGRENEPAVMIQGHLDMVCEAECDYDFINNGINLIENGDIISAENTTLGADDGAAVALMLELLSDETLFSPALECVFTTDEEIGMLGADFIDLSECRAEYLINADSEEEGVFTCGCAGGTSLDFSIPVEREKAGGECVKISVSGFLGGHSGTEINKGRLNAIKFLSSLLREDDRIVEISRDGKDNAIPAGCDAVICGNGADIKKRFDAVTDWKCEKDVKLEISPVDSEELYCLTEESQKRVLHFLQNVPFGVRKMCDEPAGLVHTSDNIGILKTEKNAIKGTLSVRSIETGSRDSLCREISALAEKCGGKTNTHGAYPGWNYKKDSKLRDTMIKVYERMNGKTPKIDVIHAGLECGVILSKMPCLDIVSIGCDVKNIHTPDECMSISSFEKMGKFVREILKELK